VQLSELFTAVSNAGYTFSALTGTPSTDIGHPIVTALNQSYRQVLGINRWPFLEKQDTSIITTFGVNSYPLSSISDLRQVDAVRISRPAIDAFYDLENVEPQEFRDKEHLDNTPANPQMWTMYAQQIKFWPFPDDTYTVALDYIYDPPDLSATTDVPVIPLKYQDCLVWGAVAKMAYRERDWLGRNFALQEFNTMLKQLQEEYLLRQRQTSSHVRRSGSWDTKVPWPIARMTW
jgi:hypothetical protein